MVEAASAGRTGRGVEDQAACACACDGRRGSPDERDGRGDAVEAVEIGEAGSRRRFRTRGGQVRVRCRGGYP